MELSAASFSYPNHDGPARAGLTRSLLRGHALNKGFVLSTCLRVEVVVPGDESLLEATLDELFGATDLVPDLRSGEGAVHHLFRVAAGLESPIVGEREVFTQFRQALIEAEDAGRVGGLFARLLEAAVATGRQTREVLPSSPHDSMAAVAAQAVGMADRVAVLGSGLMATAVVDGLLNLPAPPEVTVVARHPEKVAERDGVTVHGFDHVAATLTDFPAVITATSAKQRLVDDDTLASVLADREGPLLLVDMAMPPDFRPPASGLVRYVSIDDLARMAERRPQSEEADTLVAETARDAWRQFHEHDEVGPLIGGLISSADDIVDRAVGRFAGRLGDPADESVLRQSAHTVARTLLAGPVAYLKSETRPDEALDVIADAFGLSDG